MENSPSLSQFRSEVYQHFEKRPDTLLELIDALSSNQTASSVAELSLAPCFRREYSALYKGVADCTLTDTDLAVLAAPYLPAPEERAFRLLAVDVSPQPRLYSPTLTDRGCVYEPTVIRGNKPITLGHQYSTVVALPEKVTGDAPWVIPFSVQRVASTDDKELVGAEQVQALLTNPQLPFVDDLCVGVTDSSYSKPAFLHILGQLPNYVNITRVRSNRVFYRQFVPDPTTPATAGHPRWYGERFALRDPATWGEPEATHTLSITGPKGTVQRVEIQAWHNLLMRGKRKPTPCPMHRYPFTLVRIQIYRADGTTVYRNPLWLIVVGERRAEITLPEIFHAYRQRFDIEHGYRFKKQRLLLTAYQTPETAHEENWWRLVHLAYLQLWVARPLAQRLPRPWERYLPTMKTTAPASPAFVQRDYARIIQELGTPAQPPKRRGYSPGRAAGTIMPARERHDVVVKSKTDAKTPATD
jgi:hypothetical protein